MTLRHVLRVERGPSSGERFGLEIGRTVIGRGKRCGIRLQTSWCSREHCAVDLRAGGEAWLVDLASKNGTSVNGLPVDRHRLRPGDRIGLGDATLAYLEEEEAPRRGGIHFSDDEDETATLDVDIGHPLPLEEVVLPSGAARDDPWRAGLIAVISQLGQRAPQARRVEAFFADALADLLRDLPVVDGALARVDGTSRRLSSEVTARPDSKFVLRNATIDAVINRREVTLVAAKAGARLLGAPLWVDGQVGGLLCLELRPDAPTPTPEHLLMVGVLGTLIGGTVQSVGRLRTLEERTSDLEQGLQSRFEMVGQSRAMKTIFGLIEKVAPSEATVLISGESGTGKELVARAIHFRSPRRAGPYVALNAATLPVQLVESDLFGHEKGAFTGAIRTKVGKFELADKGTLFLDEVGELETEVQPKLLRVLEDGSYHRVGGESTMTSHARVIAATNQPLYQRVKEGLFREDLYFRLRVFEIRLPPLRERTEDIPLLVTHLVARLREEMGKPVEGVTGRAMETLVRYRWPGNVRELRNCLERAMVMTGEREIDRAHLEFMSGEPSSSTATPERLPSLQELEHAHIRRILEVTGGNKSKAARMLGIDRSTLYQKLKQLDGPT